MWYKFARGDHWRMVNMKSFFSTEEVFGEDVALQFFFFCWENKTRLILTPWQRKVQLRMVNVLMTGHRKLRKHLRGILAEPLSSQGDETPAHFLVEWVQHACKWSSFAPVILTWNLGRSLCRPIPWRFLMFQGSFQAGWLKRPICGPTC